MSTTSPATAVLRTEARLFGRELGSLFWILAFPTLLLLAVGLVPDFTRPDPSVGGQRVVDVYTGVSVVLATIMAAIMAMPPVLAGYRESGVLRRLRTTPVHPGTLLGAQVGLHASAALVSVGLAVLVARLAYGVPMPDAVLWYVFVVVLATAAAFAVGAVVTAVSASTRVGQTVGTIVFFPMMFTAGVWVPLQAMPGWLHTLVTATPLGAASEALEAARLGTAPAWIDLAVTAGWTVVLALVAVRLFRWQ